ncbi:MIF4G domain protein [Reticulomyxa filosa]|uniref:MIF4G domain protein n=1 Tax=Reticulomyxa filosa TaxID=46433 RepID=X6MG77_RETFI|nr:MIF4G domain protein [Reticulomyxa filosa]|eukprot:ETO13028.1 MIF4G domain protein [Reticulomyxa filosa]
MPTRKDKDLISKIDGKKYKVCMLSKKQYIHIHTCVYVCSAVSIATIVLNNILEISKTQLRRIFFYKKKDDPNAGVPCRDRASPIICQRAWEEGSCEFKRELCAKTCGYCNDRADNNNNNEYVEANLNGNEIDSRDEIDNQNDGEGNDIGNNNFNDRASDEDDNQPENERDNILRIRNNPQAYLL